MQIKPTLTKEVANFEVQWEGHTVQFSAKRHCLTPKLMERFTDIEKHPMQMSHALAEILTEWSIEDVSCTDAEDIGTFIPVEFQSKIIEKIGETWAGEKKSQAVSASGSVL